MTALTPLSEACAEVRAWQQRRALTVPAVSYMLGLSAISTGLDQIARGNVASGERVARHGLEFLRQVADEAQQ